MSDRGIQRRRVNVEWQLYYPITAGPERVSVELADEFDFDNPEAKAFRHGREVCRLGLDKWKHNSHANGRCRAAFGRGYDFQLRVMPTNQRHKLAEGYGL